MDTTKEKRHYQWVDRIIQVKYESPDNKSGLMQTSFTRDISEGGFMVRMTEEIPVGVVLSLKFYIGTTEFIPAKAEVMRIKPIVLGKLYDVGLQLKEISEEGHQMLVDYLNGN